MIISWDDIIICFQHYPTFADAKAAWDRRKKRIDYNHIGFLFYLAWDFDQKRALEFAGLGLKHVTIFTERFDIGIPHFRVDPPEGAHFLDIAENGKKYYEQVFENIINDVVENKILNTQESKNKIDNMIEYVENLEINGNSIKI